jgi:hypothetical protein
MNLYRLGIVATPGTDYVNVHLKSPGQPQCNVSHFRGH